jgi:dTDP-4-amino-4,6-dideoxygalactose transaminase
MIIFERRATNIIYKLLRSNFYNNFFLLPANICSSIPLAFITANVKFLLIDIDPYSLAIDHEKVEFYSKIEACHGVIYVRPYGNLENVEDFFRILKKNNSNFLIIDDRCLSIPVTNEVESVADIILYSTGKSKILDLGYGGFAYVNSDISYNSQKLKYYKSHEVKNDHIVRNHLQNRTELKIIYPNWLEDFTHDVSLSNYHQEINNKIKNAISHKQLINEIYSFYLNDFNILNAKFSLWRFNLLVNNKNKILSTLLRNDIPVSSHYQPLTDIFSGKVAKNATHLFSHVVNLFNDYRISEQVALKITRLIKESIH